MTKTIQMKDLHDLVTGGLAKGELILDVREPDEFAEGHIPGARNIPHEQVANHASELAKYSKIFVHCLGGGRAGKACTALESAGLANVVHIAGSGMRDWLAEGWKIEK